MINALLEEYLRHYVSTSQKIWDVLLDTAQFCYNLDKSSAIGMCPVELIIRHMLKTSLEIVKQVGCSVCTPVFQFARDKQEMIE